MAVDLDPAALVLLFVFIVGSALLVAFLAWSMSTPPADHATNHARRPGTGGVGGEGRQVPPD